MLQFLRAPLVVFGYLADRLRRLPVLGGLLFHTALVAAGLLAVAVLAFVAWAGTVAPQRVGLADLVTANLSHMQTWIIITGDLGLGPPPAGGYRYLLTEPSVPNASMYVLSDVELPLGHTTVSGRYLSGREPTPVGFPWIGTMRADPMLAPELGPPWVSIILVTSAALTLASARVSYPMFFGQSGRRVAPRAMTIQVGVRRGSLDRAGEAVTGELVVQPGEPVGLRIAGGGVQQLRLHSVHTGVDTGELRRLDGSEPALRLRQVSAELTITFASEEERDVTVAALLADAQEMTLALAPQPSVPQGELR